jgi:hypothetical protein
MLMVAAAAVLPDVQEPAEQEQKQPEPVVWAAEAVPAAE